MAPQKRTQQEADSLLSGVKALIVDIEGTTTPISFVKDTLFTYIKDNLDAHLDKHYDDTETQKDIAALRTLACKDKEESAEGVVEIPDGESQSTKEDIVKAVAENVRWQMGCDRKSTELKQLQGHILQEGYKQGAIKGDLFEDVPAVLQQLSEEGVKLYVFSSGSIEAQKLLFGHTADGDLVDLFTGFFDTTTGSKTDCSSYKTIQKEIGIDSADILFLTDNPDEAKAAVDAGMRSTLVMREGNADLTEHLKNFNCIDNFNELFGDDDYDEDLKRFEGDNGDADEDDEDPEDDEDDDEVDEENPDEEDDA